ncbi:MAG TPA: apolipoprotein N-acyltransferase [Casimicrobiaceae bacterium]|jgi:apolipoprotein N-acyltransferase|nr:apolipoprotein N-acyltransferase [Casimicrobiaceae bacterium]
MRLAPSVVAALLLGVATVLGFAPFGFSELTVLTLAALFLFWRQAQSARAAAWIGYAFGAGLFGAGASWVYIALALFGGMEGVLAGLATLAFCAYLALLPALAGLATARLVPQPSNFRFIAAASCWTLAEWLRSWLFSGFPWLSVGYAHVQTPLGGYAPLGGVFLTSLAVATSGALVAYGAVCLRSGISRRAVFAAVALLALWLAGLGLRAIPWSDPVGAPVTVSLVQGNIPEEIKFDAAYRDQTLATYAELVAQAKGRLIVLPESALPMFADEVPADYVAKLRNAALERQGDLLLGLFFFEPRQAGEDEDHYFNSVVSLGTATTQRYRKHHLVPFGETIPLKSLFGWFIRGVLHIPLADQTPGAANQAPMQVAGQRVAVNICYEDAFGGELLHALPEATLLVNVTNDAWYGRSLAAEQHEQIAAMRALETARPMLRATNTGITSIIDHHGAEIGRLPWFMRGILESAIAGRRGTTPYVRFGDFPAIAFAFLLGVGAALAWRKWRGAPLIQ